jgi:hypothetical protein
VSRFGPVNFLKASPSCRGSPSTATCFSREVAPDSNFTLALGTPSALANNSVTARLASPPSAMARTRSRQGLDFVFDHMDVLLTRAAGGGNAEESDLAAATVKVLLTASDPGSLREINKSVLRNGPNIDYEQVWQSSRDQIRKRWRDVLK